MRAVGDIGSGRKLVDGPPGGFLEGLQPILGRATDDVVQVSRGFIQGIVEMPQEVLQFALECC